MKNLKLVMFFTICFLFVGMQYATAQVKDKVEEVNATTKEIKATTKEVKEGGVKKEASQLNLEDDKRVYTTKATNTINETKKVVKGAKATDVKKIDAAAKMKGALKKHEGVNGEATIKELDSDDLEEEDLEDDN